MVITTDSGTYTLIYELALIPAIFGLDWIGSGFSGNFMDWIVLGQHKWTHVQLWCRLHTRLVLETFSCFSCCQRFIYVYRTTHM